MANIVYQLTDAEIRTLMSQIPFETSGLSQGMKAKAKYQNATIHIYHSKKVMFQGKGAEAVAAKLMDASARTNSAPSRSKSTSKSSTSKSATTTIRYDQYACIGSDEAGSGDYFGPLTVCACYVSAKNAQVLKALGIDDSKKLTDDKIVSLAEQIVTFLPHSLLVMDNEKYNIQQQKGWSQVKMKAVLHNQAIQNVCAKIDTSELDYIVIDQFAEPGVYKRYALTAIPEPQKTCFETKGESKSIAIAAASIISRYAFVKKMDALSRQMRVTIPKGASAKVDLAAAKIITQYGIAKLDTISKKHFKNRDKAQALVNKKRS